MENKRVIKTGALREAFLAVTLLKRRLTQYRPVSQRRKGVDSNFVPVYLPGQRSKKKARMMIFQVA